jgi:hypothetical protein
VAKFGHHFRGGYAKGLRIGPNKGNQGFIRLGRLDPLRSNNEADNFAAFRIKTMIRAPDVPRFLG